MTTPLACPQPEHLARLLVSGLSEDEQRELTAHLDRCPDCRRNLERLASGEEAWAETARKLGAACAAPEPRLQEMLADLQSEGLGDRTQAEPKSATDETLAFLSPPGEAGHLGRLGHYEVIEVVGRGGMGVVLKAFDTHLHRIVALKVMAEALASSASARQRFLREARAAAAVRNDHVIDIHHVGEENGLPYLVMEYIAGRSLQERLDQTGPLQLKEILRIGMQTAAGLAAAHAQGLIHRDIKPANILLENGVERVKITDFGLARAVDDASLTQSGVVTGTPQYMAPEQARGEAVDHRADLFSLGSVLYAMCAGRPPFRAGTTMGVLRLVSDAVPRPIREVNPDVSERLAVIVAKLHAKEPGERFQSAAEVAEALSQHLAELQHPDSGRLTPRVGTPSRSDGTTRKLRHRWAVVAAVVALLLGGLGMTEATGVTKVVPTVIRIVRGDGTLVVEVSDPDIQVSIAGDGDEVVIKGAGPQEIRLRPGSYRLRATKDGKLVPCTNDLVTITRGGRQLVSVSQEAGRLPTPQMRIEGPVRTFPGHQGWVINVAFSSDGHLALSGSHDRTMRLWDVKTGKELRLFDKFGAWVEAVALSPDGRRALSGSQDHTMRLWDAATGQELKCFRGHTAGVRSVAFSPDGRRALSGGQDGTVRQWDVETGKELQRFQEPNLIECIAYSPDGRQVISGSWDQTVSLWDVDTGKRLRCFRGHMSGVESVAVSPDGRLILSGSGDATVRLWDRESGRELRCYRGHEGAVNGVAFRPGSRDILSAGRDGTVRLWDRDSGKERIRFVGHRDWIFGVVCTADGRFALSGGGGKSQDGKVVAGSDFALRLWALPIDEESAVDGVEPPPKSKPLVFEPEPLPDMPLGAPLNAMTLVNRPAPLDGVRSWTVETVGHRSGVEGLAYSPDGRLLATGERGGVIRLWESDTGRLVRMIVTPSGWLTSLTWSADGKVLASACQEEAVRFWDVSSGRLLRTLHLPSALHVMAWSPNGQTLATCGWDHRIRLWDVRTGQLRDVLPAHKSDVRALAFSPDSRTLASGSIDQTARLWEVASGQLLHTLTKHQGEVKGLAWSPDGKRLASASYDRTVRVWDVASGDCLRILKGHKDHVYAVAWSPDGTRLASGSVDRLVRVWDPRSSEKLHTLEGHAALISGLAWSPDGATLTSASWDSTVRQWRTDSGQALRILPGLPAWAFNHARWSPDGRMLATGAETARLWETSTGFMSRALPAEAGIVRGWSPDSKTVFTTQWDHCVGLWDASTGQPRRRLSGHTGPVHAAACSPDGKWIASASEDHTLRLWAAATGQLLDTFQDQADERIVTIAWSLDGNGLICGGPTNKTARIWDVALGKLVQTPRKLTTGPLRTLALSPDGKTLASGGDDQVVQLWDASSCQFRRTLAKHSGMVYAVAWAPDGKMLASAGGWGEVRLWEPGTGRLLRTLKGPATPIIAVTWSADGRSVAASGEGPIVWIWDAATGRQTAVLLGLPDNRFLTVSENGHYRCSVGSGQQLRYVVQTNKGQETLTTEEFTHKYTWKNAPNQVRLTSPER